MKRQTLCKKYLTQSKTAVNKILYSIWFFTDLLVNIKGTLYFYFIKFSHCFFPVFLALCLTNFLFSSIFQILLTNKALSPREDKLRNSNFKRTK